MCANKGHQLADAEAHVGKPGRQHVDWVRGIREEAIWRDIPGCRAADESGDNWAAWAGEL